MPERWSSSIPVAKLNDGLKVLSTLDERPGSVKIYRGELVVLILASERIDHDLSDSLRVCKLNS